MTFRASPDVLVQGAAVATYLVAMVSSTLRGRLRGRWLLAGAAALGAVPSLYFFCAESGLVPGEFVRFGRPSLLPVVLIATAFTAHRLLSLRASAAGRRRFVEATTAGATLAAALAVTEPEFGGRLSRLAVLLVVDRSRSTDLVPDFEQRIVAERRVAELSMRDDDLIGVIVVGAESAVEEPLRGRAAPPSPARVAVGRDGTDLEAGIRRALAEIPPDAAARIVVLSDGVATRGKALDAAAAARIADVPVDAVPLEQRKLRNVRVASIRMASRASENEAVDLKVLVESPEATELAVRVLRDGKLVHQARARVLGGQDVIHIREIAGNPGLHRYDVEVTAPDATLDELPSDNRASGFLRVEGRSRALVLDNAPPAAAPVVAALGASGFEVETVAATSAPADVAELSTYDVVVLSDVPAHDFSPTQLEAIGSYVQALGGGLILLGGPQSMGPGGYGATAVERVSPVSFDLKQSRRRASLAEIIIIDFSGSMSASAGRHSKLELANEAAVRSAELLGDGDRLGVLHVDDRPHWTVTPGPAKRPEIPSTIRRVAPGGGGIFVDLALTTAFEALASEKTNLKHVLLFSDGSDAEEKQRAPQLVRAARSRGVTTSVVALGRGPDVPALEALSRDGDGRFYLIEDATRLPAVFAQETIAATRSAINEVPFKPVPSAPARATRDIDWEGAPALTGYVVTLPKDRTEILLQGPENDPVLATSAVGVGRTAAFTSDFKGRWSAEFLRFPGAAQLLAQVARDVARREEDPRVRLSARAEDGRLQVRAEALRDDGRADTFRHFTLRASGPDGWERTVPLEPSAAGAYTAEIPLSRPGAFAISVADENGVVGTTAVLFSPADEMRPTGTDRQVLRTLATVSGGKLRDTLAGVFDDRSARRYAYRPMSPALVLFAAIGLLASVAGRRASVPDAIPRALKALRARLGRSPDDGATSTLAGRTATALLSAKQARRARYPKPLGKLTAGHAPAAPLPAARPSPVVRATPPAERAPPSPAPSPKAAPAPSVPKKSRPLTSAEILLARRRERR